MVAENNGGTDIMTTLEPQPARSCRAPLSSPDYAGLCRVQMSPVGKHVMGYFWNIAADWFTALLSTRYFMKFCWWLNSTKYFPHPGHRVAPSEEKITKHSLSPLMDGKMHSRFFRGNSGVKLGVTLSFKCHFNRNCFSFLRSDLLLLHFLLVWMRFWLWQKYFDLQTCTG